MKNWKSTLMGFLAGTAVLVGSAYQNKQLNPTAPPVTAGNLIPSLVLMAWGLVQKDHDVTGGTRPQ